MKSIVRIFAHRKANEAGFAIPAVLGFGFVALLIGSIFLVRSQNDRTVAALQRSSDSSLNVTEAGITQVQSFLNRAC